MADAAPYPFDAKSSRTPAEIDAMLELLLDHIGYPGNVSSLPAEARERLRVYVNEVHFNIQWYQQALKTKRRQSTYYKVGSVAAGVLVMGLMLGTLYASHLAADATDWVSQVGVLGTSAFGLLRVIGGLTNTNTEISGFWQASSNLKEGLYSFENTWRARLAVELQDKEGAKERKEIANRLLQTGDFRTALFEELRNARKFVQAERAAFFAASATATEVNTATSGAVDAVRGSLTTLVGAREENARVAAVTATSAAQASASLVAARANEIELVRRELLTAKAKVVGVEAEIGDQAATPEQTAKLAAARGVVAEKEAFLQSLLRLDRLNRG